MSPTLLTPVHLLLFLVPLPTTCPMSSLYANTTAPLPPITLLIPPPSALYILILTPSLFPSSSLPQKKQYAFAEDFQGEEDPRQGREAEQASPPVVPLQG